MCGIAVIAKRHDAKCAHAALQRMRDEVDYRGPDDSGTVFFRRTGLSALSTVEPCDSDWELGMAHRRLSILDLTASARQPMVYRDRWWLVYNGELYNYLEIRTELERLGHSFRSTSDTEVVLASYAEWGPSCVSRFRGMWAIVLADTMRRELFVCRDRLGIKPLYVWESPELFILVSELKQLQHIPAFRAKLNTDCADEYLDTGYESPERTFFQDVHPIRPASWVRLPLDDWTSRTVQDYWHPERISVSVDNPAEASRLFSDKIEQSVRLHMRSDVPVGCALSGGLDSSAIAVLAAQPALHTFTVTFPGNSRDERWFADAVAACADTVRHYVTPNPDDFLHELDRFVWVHDEPVGSLQMYAGYCLARLSRQMGVPVLLNGQGGDEILSGYWQCYFLHLRDLCRSGDFRRVIGHCRGALSRNGNPSLLTQVPSMLRRYRARSVPFILRRRGRSGARHTRSVLGWVLSLDPQTRRVHETRTIFLPRLLKWEDRNSMAFSVEGRYPFLDHELIELCLSFAPATLYSRGWTKYPLRMGLNGDLPAEVRWRRTKFGLETPQDDWLCGPLKPALERWLTTTRPIWDYVSREAVQRLAATTWRGKQDEPGQALFRCFILDRWLNLFNVGLG